MPDCDDQDDQDLFRHLVNDAVVADPYTVKVIDSAELLAAGWARIHSKSVQSAADP